MALGPWDEDVIVKKHWPDLFLRTRNNLLKFKKLNKYCVQFEYLFIN